MREVNCDQGVHCEKTETVAGSDAYTLFVIMTISVTTNTGHTEND